MELADFLNLLKSLRVIERHELRAVGVLGVDTEEGWIAFRSDPARWLIQARDEDATKVWELARSR